MLESETTEHTDEGNVKQTDLEVKYNRLKRKYDKLFEVAFTLSEELHKSKETISRLQKEKNFLLDKIIKSEDEGRYSKRKKTFEPSSPGGESSTPRRGAQSPVTSGCSATMHGRPCRSKPLEGFSYCWRHSPLDPNSPYVFCKHIDPVTNRKCQNPVPKTKSDGLCTFHTSKQSTNEGDMVEDNISISGDEKGLKDEGEEDSGKERIEDGDDDYP